MRILKLATFAGVLSLAMALVGAQRGGSGTTLFEGARLIVGDGSAPIENGALLVENGQILKVGKKGDVRLPAGAARVDLTGKTVIPALINVHTHPGYELLSNRGYVFAAPENYTPDNLVDHLQRFAFYGVGAINDGGTAPVSVALQFQSDDVARKFPPHAQFLFAAGIVPPGGGVSVPLINGTRPLHAQYEVLRATEARAAVQDVAAKNIPRIKIWLGDRGGTYPAMPHEVYDAVIDEAHKHGIRVHAHATTLRDQKDALRAGADVIIHTITNVKIDEELVELVKERKPFWSPVMGTAGASPLCTSANVPFIEQTAPPKIVADVLATCNAAANAGRGGPAGGAAAAAAREENTKYNFNKMVESGAHVLLGTDTGVSPNWSFGWADHFELEHYVQLGMSPMDALVAATSRPAQELGLKNAGVLAEGKTADFVVLNANPLDDIRNTRDISNVYLHGAKLDRDGLRAILKKAGAPQ
jgi:imidazolonepropionase-like amidohydrolase